MAIICTLNQDCDKILYSDEVPFMKMYKIAKLLRENERLQPQLWYAILEYKDSLK